MTAEAWILLATLAVIMAGGVAVWGSRANSGAAANRKVEQLERDLAEFKEKVAREYATASMVTAIETRVVAAIDRLGERFSDRIDRILEGRSGVARTRPSAK